MQLDRNYFIDFCKGITIILVVIGHVIQFVDKSFYNSKIFIFIYSFHMPLFIAISGYLFSKTLKNKNVKEIIISKSKQLLFPLFCWTSVLVLVTNIITKNSDYNIISYIKNYTSLLPRFYWFLPVLFLSSMLLAIMYKFSIKTIYKVIFIILLFAIPDFSSFKYFKYLLPFFLIGYHLESIKNVFMHFSKSSLKYIYIGSFFLFVLLLREWKSEYYIYTSGMNLINYSWMDDNMIIHQFLRIFYRFIIGLFGCITALYTLSKLFSYVHNTWLSKFIEKLGSYSLGIYCIHLIILNLNQFNLILNINYISPFILISILSVLLILASAYLTNLLERFNLTKVYFLGGR